MDVVSSVAALLLGVGYGLYACWSVARLHGTRVRWMHSAAGCAWVLWPLSLPVITAQLHTLREQTACARVRHCARSRAYTPRAQTAKALIGDSSSVSTLLEDVKREQA